MSIRDRIEDAVFLWQGGRREAAFLSALVAISATARKRFPGKKVGDRQAFEDFVRSAHTIRLSVEYRGEVHPIEHIFYKWFRCELVHEGALPVDIEMVESEETELWVRAGGAPSYRLLISYGWFWHLLKAAANAPENDELYPETATGSAGKL